MLGLLDRVTEAPARRWMELAVNQTPPLDAELDALLLDYKPIEIYARDAGLRSAVLMLDIGGRDRASIDHQMSAAMDRRA